MEKQKTVVFVEDEIDQFKVISNALSNDGIDVQHASDGIECLEYCKNNACDFIIMDLHMPRMSGLEALAKIREDDSLKDIPVLVLTNYGDSEKVAEALSYGVTDYLIKSDETLKEIIKIVKKRLGQ